jgi:hypothetical protein
MLEVDFIEPALSSPELAALCDSSMFRALANRFAKFEGACRFFSVGRGLRAGLVTTEITLEIATGWGAGTTDALTLPPYNGTVKDNGRSFGFGPSGGDFFRVNLGFGGGDFDLRGCISSFAGGNSDVSRGDSDFAGVGGRTSSSAEVSVSDFSAASSRSSSLQDPLSSTSRIVSTLSNASIAFSSSSPLVALAFS